MVRRGVRAAPRLAQRHRRPGHAVLEPYPGLPQPDHGLYDCEGREVGIPIAKLPVCSLLTLAGEGANNGHA
ncbi:hypothetical protein CBM2599_B140173 [Cupriavidus taiwanensis]|nr:hypothetical protein CBM2599_B140173 [Cupriavidus taiwanensis]SOY99447.1 hypothetical protein CBM2600_B60189 [Cupriavidus taiwanensis]